MFGGGGGWEVQIMRRVSYVEWTHRGVSDFAVTCICVCVQSGAEAIMKKLDLQNHFRIIAIYNIDTGQILRIFVTQPDRMYFFSSDFY